MYASLLLALPLLGFVVGQDDRAGGCESGSQVADHCCDGDVITTGDGNFNSDDISNLVCCAGDGTSGSLNFGGSSCAPGQTSVPFSELSTAGNSGEGSTVVVSNDSTIMGASTTDMTATSTSTSSAAETSSGGGSQDGAKSTTDTSTGVAAMMTSGPMAGALVMAGGFMVAAM